MKHPIYYVIIGTVCAIIFLGIISLFIHTKDLLAVCKYIAIINVAIIFYLSARMLQYSRKLNKITEHR